MGWQPGGADDRSEGTDPARGHGVPGQAGFTPAAVYDPRVSDFAKDGEWDACSPSAALTAVLEAVSGPEWRCPGASTDEMVGLLRQAQAIESWAAAIKLGVVRALIRDDDAPLPGGGYHGDLPEGWSKSLTHEVALALSMPVVSADRLMWAAWDLQARLTGIGELLAAGVLTYAKAKAVHEAFLLLSDENAARAEALILPDLPGKTFSQVKRLAEQAAITVDPESAARRREHAERENSRVTISREDSGAVALSGRDLPTDEALAAHAHVCARARQYQESGAFPNDTGMDQFRVAAYLDLLNSKPAETRIAVGQLDIVTRAAEAQSAEAQPGDDGPDGDGHSRGEPGDGGPGAGPGGGSPGSPRDGGSVGVTPPRLADLVLPLATLLGLAERPGEGHALGPLDPGLCRELALAAIGSPWTRLCITVTDSQGIALGHGCAERPRTTTNSTPDSARQPANPIPSVRAGLDLPAQLNLTVTAACLAELVTAGLPGAGNASWSFTCASDSGPPGGFGVWTLTLPDGRQLTMALEPMPTLECDHRHESHAYQPNDRLRHLVQVRDYTCTFPPCNRHAKESDFEHAIPYDQGGRTCACNAGARSRACHQVKQTKGWKVTQPRPGWHQWQTPSGRVYVQAPKRYPI
jgi:Domain of unknown function (DUF222)